MVEIKFNTPAMHKPLFIPFLLITVFFPSCEEEGEVVTDSSNQPAEDQVNGNQNLLNFLKESSSYIHEIDGFYIVSSNENPVVDKEFPNASAKDIFEASTRYFSSFLDQDENGEIDNEALLKALSENYLFVIGHRDYVEHITDAQLLIDEGYHGIAMFTDEWPYNASFTGKDWEFESLESSLWRPEGFNALWEEVFHTITEGFTTYLKGFEFTSGSTLSGYMEADIAANSYDTSEQNELENGVYDKVTAVSEYIHQIWMINYGGHENKLNVYQKNTLDFMIESGIPMNLNPDYKSVLGTTIME